MSKKNKKSTACVYLRKSSEEKVEAPATFLSQIIEAVDSFQTQSLSERVKRGNESLLKRGINPYGSSSVRISQYRCLRSKANRHAATDNLVIDLLEAVQKYEKAVRAELIKQGKEMERRRQSKQA